MGTNLCVTAFTVYNNMVAAFDTTDIVCLANKFFALSTLEVHVIG